MGDEPWFSTLAFIEAAYDLLDLSWAQNDEDVTWEEASTLGRLNAALAAIADCGVV